MCQEDGRTADPSPLNWEDKQSSPLHTFQVNQWDWLQTQEHGTFLRNLTRGKRSGSEFLYKHLSMAIYHFQSLFGK